MAAFGALHAAILRNKQLFEGMLLSIGPDATVTFAETGETRQIKVFQPARQDIPLTGGQVQEDRYMLASVDQLAATSPPREPRKGDIITVKGMKFAIMSAVKEAALDELIAWRFQVRG